MEFFADVLDKKEGDVKSDLAPLRIQRVKGNQYFEFVFNRSKDRPVHITGRNKILYTSRAAEKDGEVVIEPSGVAVFCF